MAEVTLESLASQMEEQRQQIAEQQAIITKQAETINGIQAAALQSEVKEDAPLSIPKEAVKVGNKEYMFNVATFSFPGSDKKHIAEDLVVANDQKIFKQVLAIEGQGILRELA